MSAIPQPFITESVKRYTLGVLVVVYTFNFIDRQILSILIEPIKADLGVSDFAMGLLSGTAFAIFYATLGMPLALIADRWNRRNLIGISLAIWSGSDGGTQRHPETLSDSGSPDAASRCTA